MSLEEKRRAAFDAWWIEYRGFPCPHDGGAWEAWNAALDSVVVELPEAWRSSGSTHELMHKHQTIAAIEAAGVKVKP